MTVVLLQVAPNPPVLLVGLGSLLPRPAHQPAPLSMYEAKTPQHRKNGAFEDLAGYPEWPKVAAMVTEALPFLEHYRSLLDQVSLIEWDNVILYGQYALDRNLIR